MSKLFLDPSKRNCSHLQVWVWKHKDSPITPKELLQDAKQAVATESEIECTRVLLKIKAYERDKAALASLGAVGVIDEKPEGATDGEKTEPTEAAGEGKDAVGTGRSGKLSVRELAAKYGVKANSLRNRLDRWRLDGDTGYVEVQNRKPRQARFLYDEDAVAPVIADLKSSGKRAPNARRKNS